MSKTIQERIDALYEARAERLKEQRRIDELKNAEDLEMNAILGLMVEEGIESLQGECAKVTAKETVEPEVTDWTTLQAFIRETGQIDLLQKRVMVSAVKARWETGDDVPGVERMIGHKLVIGALK